MGEQGGRPVYKKNSTKEFLYYGGAASHWLVGPDFQAKDGGIQMLSSEDHQCPERMGGQNMTRMFVDPSAGGKGWEDVWRMDDTLELACYREGVTRVQQCSCNSYQVSLTPARPTVGEQEVGYLHYLEGKYSRVRSEDSYDLLAPLYRNEEKGTLLFSHHPEGLVWQVEERAVVQL